MALPENQEARLRCYRNALKNWNYQGYVRFKERVQQWFKDELPDHTLRGIAQVLHEFIENGGDIDEQVERRAEWVEFEFISICACRSAAAFCTLKLYSSAKTPTIRMIQSSKWLMFTMSDPIKNDDRVFPWRCSRCKEKLVFPAPHSHSTVIKHDGQPYAVHLPNLLIPTCRACGERTFTPKVDDHVFAALREQLDLLAPQQILNGRIALGLTQPRLAEQLGVSADTVSRWEAGEVIQSRAMDNLLRLYFESGEARDILQRLAPRLSKFQSASTG